MRCHLLRTWWFPRECILRCIDNQRTSSCLPGRMQRWDTPHTRFVPAQCQRIPMNTGRKTVRSPLPRVLNMFPQRKLDRWLPMFARHLGCRNQVGSRSMRSGQPRVHTSQPRIRRNLQNPEPKIFLANTRGIDLREGLHLQSIYQRCKVHTGLVWLRCIVIVGNCLARIVRHPHTQCIQMSPVSSRLSRSCYNVCQGTRIPTRLSDL